MSENIIKYYDRESEIYSAKRYPEKTNTYIQYLFKKRLSILISMLEEIEPILTKDATILEIGCADGVVFKSIEERFPGRFSKLIGIDISPKMIEQAKKQNINPRAQFFLRENFPQDKYDIIIMLGVHPFHIDAELDFISKQLASSGYFFYSVAGQHSKFIQHNHIEESTTKDYKSYSGYEKIFSRYFNLVDSKAYGYYLRGLWKIPVTGRILQPIIDNLPVLNAESFHEQLYLLKNSR